MFQTMQCTTVERTFCNLLYVYGRGRRRCGGPTIQAVRFPLVGNAHRAFRGGKRLQTPFGRATVRHENNEFNLHNVKVSNYAMSVRRTHVLQSSLRLRSRTPQVRRPYDSSGEVSACRERTPGVPRWKTFANTVRSGDGET